MRRYRYVEPGADSEPVQQVMTEAEILAEYFPYWSNEMRRVGKADLISEQRCIEDYVTIHWAELVSDDD